MKQCPVCNTQYSDDSLSFCLSDGAGLVSPIDEETRIINRQQINFPAAAPVAFNVPQQPEKRSSANSLVVPGIIALVVLLIVGAAGAYLLVPPQWLNQSTGSNTLSSPTPARDSNPTPARDSKTDELENKVANLERQLQNKDKTNPLPSPTASLKVPDNTSHTARVNSPHDGFLAMRSLPNSQTGTQIVQIPHGATVTVSGCQDPIVISGRRGRWCQVAYDGFTGWAFDAWLMY
jgi:Bacterial SH3 domain